MELLPILLALKEARGIGGGVGVAHVQLAAALDRFRRMIRSMVGGTLADEDDLLSEAAMKIVDRADEFRGHTEGEAVRFCQTVVRNGVIDFGRRQRWRFAFLGRGSGRAPENEAQEQTKDVDRVHERLEVTPEQAAMYDQFHRALLDQIKRLDNVERELIWRFAVLDEPVHVTAADLGLKENSATKRRMRAMNKVRIQLIHTVGFPDLPRWSERAKSPAKPKLIRKKKDPGRGDGDE